MEIEYKDLGERIKQARKQAGLSQVELADLTKISYSHMSDIETGKKKIGLDKFMRICESLDVSADSLLRINTHSVGYIQTAEVEELLSECSSDQRQALIRILKEIKAVWRHKED